MAGLFSKGGGQPLTPAQQQLQQLAIEQAKQVSNTWMPVQEYFAQQIRSNSPGLEALVRSGAAGGARALGSAATLQALAQDSSSGAGAGSGRFLADLGIGNNQTASAAGMGLVDATGAAERHYVQGLQEILGMGQRDQSVAQHGLETAANEQAQEAGAVASANQASAQAAGQTIGTAATLVAAFA